MVYSFFTEQPREQPQTGSNDFSLMDALEKIVRLIGEKEIAEDIKVSDLIQED